MKNIISTFAVIAVFGFVVGIALFLYVRFVGSNEGTGKLEPEEAAIDITERLGMPFESAWASRDVSALKKMIRGEFGAGIASSVPWTTEILPPFESKMRNCTEEDELSTTDFDVFFGYLLDPMFGLENLQTEFSLLEIVDYSDERNKNNWQCRIFIRGTGTNQNSGVTSLSFEQDVNIVLPDKDSNMDPAFLYWEVRAETFRQSQQPVMERINEILSQRGYQVDELSGVTLDVADFDNDDDLDIAMSLSDGMRFVFEYDDQGYQEVADRLGITVEKRQSGENTPMRTVWFDFDSDGDPDLISGDRLYENQNGEQFIDITTQTGFDRLIGDSDVNSMGRVRRYFGSK